MAPRWKGKTSKQKSLNKEEALANPMSKIISQLQSSLTESTSEGLLTGCSVLLPVKLEQSVIMERACFGKFITTIEKDRRWFQLSLEEAFYLCCVLKCIKITGEKNCVKNDEELWRYMTSKNENFPFLFKAYSHLRLKNWVVRSGSQYGVDFLAYQHRPSLVHSEYSVIVLSKGDSDSNGRLRVPSDYQCTLRICDSVAKTLLVLRIEKNGSDYFGPCLEGYIVEERMVTCLNPKQSSEGQSIEQKETVIVHLA